MDKTRAINYSGPAEPISHDLRIVNLADLSGTERASAEPLEPFSREILLS